MQPTTLILTDYRLEWIEKRLEEAIAKNKYYLFNAGGFWYCASPFMLNRTFAPTISEALESCKVADLLAIPHYNA